MSFVAENKTYYLAAKVCHMFIWDQEEEKKSERERA